MKMGFALLGDMTVSPYFAGPRMLKKRSEHIRTRSHNMERDPRVFKRDTYTRKTRK
jgi:hypothetical protein